MATLAGRSVVVTGAGRGLGRQHALLLGAEGASVVVNDLGCELDGSASDPEPARQVAEEIVAAGGQAVASTADVRTFQGAQDLLTLTLDRFGDVHGLVNNAGVLRDRMFVNMSPEEWDDVMVGQLRATFCPTRVFAGHWRDRSKAGDQLDRSVVNTSSTSGLIGTPGQSNYGTAKAGIAAMTVIVAAELERYGIRVNAISPVARTRMTENVPSLGELLAAPQDPKQFDVYDPGNVSPVVAWLLTAGCPATGRVFYSKGGEIKQFLGWHYGKALERQARWTVAELIAEMNNLV